MQQCCKALIFFCPLEFREHTPKKNTRKKESKKKIIKKNSQKKKVSVGDAIADCCNNMEKYRSHNFTVPNEIKIY